MTFSAQEDRSPYLRAADYVAAALLFLRDNLLLTQPLRPQHITREGRLPGRPSSSGCPTAESTAPAYGSEA